jgi:PAS domain S-box-containing protein
MGFVSMERHGMRSGRISEALGLDRRARKRLRRQTLSSSVTEADWGLLDLIPDAAIALDSDGNVAGANEPAGAIFGRPAVDLIGVPVDELFSDASAVERAPREGSKDQTREQLLARRADGQTFPVEASLRAVKGPWGDAVVAVLRDTSAEVKADALKTAEKVILEMIAAGEPLHAILDVLARSIESVSDGMLASILLMEPGGARLTHGAAPSLPPGYIEELGLVPVGPSIGSCGTAAFRKELVVARDIATDPRWTDFKDLALRYDLRACWSNPILSADGSVLGTFALYYREPRDPHAEDITLVQRATHLAGIAIERDGAEKIRQETEGRYRTLAELTSDFAYAFSFAEDGTAKVDWITEAFTRITGYDSEEWESRGAWRGIIHPDDLLAFEQRLPRLLRGEEVSSEFRIIAKSGDVRWLSVYSRPIMDDDNKRVIGVVGAAQDFTTRKEAEDAKTMFLATASHELKTPLTVIHGFAQLMGTGGMGTSDAEREAADAIERRARQLNSILDRILLSSRIETGRTQVTLGDVDLAAILNDSVTALRSVTNREVTFESADLPAAWADGNALTTVIDHLLDNAVKYSPDGGTIAVSTRPESGVVWVDVSDHGIGMTPDQVAHCFEKFWQAESGDIRRFGGTGIGLFIVRSLVEAMGGGLEIKSEPGVGSTFSFSVRIRQAPAGGHDTDDAPKPGRGQRTSIQEFMRQIGVPEVKK